MTDSVNVVSQRSTTYICISACCKNPHIQDTIDNGNFILIYKN